MKWMMTASAALLLPLLLSGGAEAADAKPDARAAWERTVAAAKKEGEVRIWGDMEITHPDIVAAFTKEYPFIKAVLVSGKVGDLMPRITAERRAGKYLADVYSGGLGGRAFYDFQRAGVLDPLKPALMLPEVVDESKWLGGRHYYADAEGQYVFMYEGSVAGVGLFYNTKLLDPKEFHSYWDALQPKWKGKVVLFERPGTGSPNMVRVFYNPQLGPEFVRRLWTEMDLIVSQERRQATDWLGTGKFTLCFDCADTDMARKQGVPVNEFDHANLKEAGGEIGTSGNSGLALINRAANPNAARVLINWFLSRQGQTVWQEVMNKKVVEPSDSMRVDVPKDVVLPSSRREEGKKYAVTGFQDPDPVMKLINEIRAKNK
ncbi:MAG TPA: ABC transporter substrate-binding protein [Candidatus Binatia bacterium]